MISSVKESLITNENIKIPEDWDLLKIAKDNLKWYENKLDRVQRSEDSHMFVSSIEYLQSRVDMYKNIIKELEMEGNNGTDSNS